MFIFFSICCVYRLVGYSSAWSPHNIVTNLLNCYIIVRKFKLQLYYHFHFWTNALGKGINSAPPIPVMIWIIPLLFFSKDGSSIKQPIRSWYAIKQTKLSPAWTLILTPDMKRGWDIMKVICCSLLGKINWHFIIIIKFIFCWKIKLNPLLSKIMAMFMPTKCFFIIILQLLLI